jgi:outer membrane cobalamin receptor
MIIINGKKAGSQVGMNDINENAVKNINILKGKVAVEKYGKEGENGVIEISTDMPSQILIKVAIGHPMPPVPAVPPVEKKETSPDKVVNGWKVSGVSSLDGTKPLIVVDGKTMNPNFNIEDIPKEQIKKIDVLKGKIAQDKYGVKALNGVIEIETKGFSKN